MSSKCKTTQKRHRLTYQEYIEIHEKANAGINLLKIAAEYKIDKSTVSHIKHKKQYKSMEKGINPQRKAMQPSKYKDLDDQLKKWYLEQKKLGNKITYKLLYEKAKEIINNIGGPPTNTLWNWMQYFKNRHNIQLCSTKFHQYSKEVDEKLFNWLLVRKIKEDKILPEMLRNKTKKLMDKFGGPSTNNAMNCWLYKFMKCYEILIKPNILQNFDKKNDASNLSDLDKQLLDWLIERKKSGATISHEMLIDKTRKLKDKFSRPLTKKEEESWVWRIGKRYHIVSDFQDMDKISENVIQINDEANQSDAKTFIQEFSQRLEKENISRDNIYSIVKPDLIWKILLHLLLDHADKRKIEEKQIDVTKLKENLSIIILCTNVTGSHRPQHFIYEHKNENENQGVLKHRERLLVAHKLKENISPEESEEKDFAYWYNNRFKTSVREHQLEKNITGKVFLLVDNCVQHIFSEKKINTKDDGFEIVFLPTNTVSLFEPLHPDIIEEVNRIFYDYMLERVRNFSYEDKEFNREYNYSYCVSTIWKAWKLLSSEDIEKLWKKFLRQGHQTQEDSLTLTVSSQELSNTVSDEIPVMHTSVENTGNIKNKRKKKINDATESSNKSNIHRKKFLNMMYNITE